MKITRLATKISPKFNGYNNKPTIISQKFYENGNIRETRDSEGNIECYYATGGKHCRIEPNGLEKGWYMTGKVSYTKFPNGIIKTFYENGLLKSISRPDRTFENWDENGILRVEKKSDGRIITYPSEKEKIITYPNGKVEKIKID